MEFVFMVVVFDAESMQVVPVALSFPTVALSLLKSAIADTTNTTLVSVQFFVTWPAS
jgi:hypothetical protein